MMKPKLMRFRNDRLRKETNNWPREDLMGFTRGRLAKCAYKSTLEGNGAARIQTVFNPLLALAESFAME